jgi:hypothetical protein
MGELLKNDKRREYMAANCGAVARIDAAEVIAEKIMDAACL